MIVIRHRGECRELPAGADYDAVLQEMFSRLGPWVPGESSVDFTPDTIAVGEPIPGLPIPEIHRTPNAVDFTPTPESNTDRALRLNAAIGHDSAAAHKAGVQFYATGTALEASGVSNQLARRQEHDQQDLARLEIGRFVERIQAEKRFERVMTAGDIAKAITMNGSLKVNGYKLRETAIRQLLARASVKDVEGKDADGRTIIVQNAHHSPALSYVLGLRDRIAAAPKAPQAQRDRDKLLATMQHELSTYPDTEYMLRHREGLGDIFSAPSPSYGIADVPLIAPSILRYLPDDARASVSYDPGSTRWEIRASVHTPTPAELQVVGEPFEAFSVFRSYDSAMGSLEIGGGFLIIRCRNATIYIALEQRASRRHRSRVLVDLSTSVRQSTQAMHKLLAAWGTARESEIALPTIYDKATDSEILVPVETAIPGFFRAMLTARKGELLGVLPGRTEQHVQALALAYPDQRRDPDRIVRTDLANAWTRYAQEQPGPVRRDAEAAIGAWIVSKEPVGYLAS